MQSLLPVVALVRERPGCEAGGGGCGDAEDGFSSTAGGACWLCRQPADYNLDGEYLLCFSCMRRMIILCVLPRVATPRRRRDDARLIAEIQKLLKSHSVPPATAPRASEGNFAREAARQGRDSCDTVSVVDPLQAHAVMSRSSATWRRTQQGGEAGGSRPPNSAALCEDPCGARQVRRASPVVCRFCGANCRFGEERVSRCRGTNFLHIPWTCDACGVVNAVESDKCYACDEPLVWACPQCTAEQRSCRSAEGMRCCCVCNKYSTPQQVVESYRAMAERRGGAEAGPGVEFGVNDAETIAEKRRQEAIEEAKGRLAERVAQLGLQRVNEQVSDGNCLFRCLANQLFGSPGDHALLRRLVVDYMRRRAQGYSVLFDGEAEWQEYLREMRRDGVWGDELCLNAAARCFRVNIHVITSDAARWHLVFQHEELRGARSAVASLAAQPATPERNSICLFLLYIAPVHFNDVVLHPAAAIDVRRCLEKSLRHMQRDEDSRQDVGEDVAGPPPPPASPPPHQKRSRSKPLGEAWATRGGGLASSQANRH
ncbi:uncharacterized protein Tco025E_05402 [Trypanosoma conorhini]|uniref:OTU domain-containing protein n=1 Tax=Trypanosoma conorhini TaxID=83891 RepID=A0A3R7KZV4_9TRYP|nr:uncharacterized protein Tco025E_05402 [Trypanosoma conorhini]RNF16822.1 hypothetical protein Tco025E_05402 [Trypanosoma conorhini]